jgi:hypothetical protein
MSWGIWNPSSAKLNIKKKLPELPPHQAAHPFPHNSLLNWKDIPEVLQQSFLWLDYCGCIQFFAEQNAAYTEPQDDFRPAKTYSSLFWDYTFRHNWIYPAATLFCSLAPPVLAV